MGIQVIQSYAVELPHFDKRLFCQLPVLFILDFEDSKALHFLAEISCSFQELRHHLLAPVLSTKTKSQDM
jgi:hypothetical protein